MFFSSQIYVSFLGGGGGGGLVVTNYVYLSPEAVVFFHLLLC